VNEQKYLSKQKAARRLDVCEKTIDRLGLRGDLDWIKVGSASGSPSPPSTPINVVDLL